MSKLQPNLNRLTRKRKQGKGGSLPAAENRPAIGPSISIARAAEDTTDTSPDTSGAIASPLTEIPGTRQYYDAVDVVSSDGLFVLQWSPVSTLKFTDANDNQVVFNFENSTS